MKKRYKLLKDLPGLKRGSCFEARYEDSDVYRAQDDFEKYYYYDLKDILENPDWFQALTEEEEIELPETAGNDSRGNSVYSPKDFSRWVEQVTNTLNSLKKEKK